MTEHRISLERLASIRDGSGHSIFSASGSPMYLECAGSLIPNLLAGDAAGYDAAYGTVAHGVSELWLRSMQRPDHLIGETQFIPSGDSGNVITIDAEMLEYVRQSVEKCFLEPGDWLIECKVKYSHLTPIPNQGGTLDFGALRPGVATIIDHKYGQIKVDADSSQLKLYGVGARVMFEWMYEKPFEKFIFKVHQPRINHFDEFEMSRAELLEFEDYARERMAVAWSYDAPRTPGTKQCRFCKVRASCAANAKLQEDLVGSAFGDTTVQTAEDMQTFVARLGSEQDSFQMRFASVHDLSTEQMARLLPFREMAESWWKSLHEELTRRANGGVEIPDYKLVETRTHRQFVSPSRAADDLQELGVPRDKLYSEKLCTPAEAERQLLAVGFTKKQLPTLLNGLVYKPPGEKVLVPANDRRPEARDISADAFGDESQNV